MHIYIYIYIYRERETSTAVTYLTFYSYIHGAFKKFPDFFFVQAFKMVVDSWKFSVIAIHLMR